MTSGMTPDDFRRIALSMPGAIESSHMGHPDFRAAGKIFATLGPPGKVWAMVKLTPEQQRDFVAQDPAMFAPGKGGWGRSGATNIELGAVEEAVLRGGGLWAWVNVSRASESKRMASPRRKA